MNFLVSIIIPTFNREYFIEETLASICAQEYENWEAIIVDDGSTDRTLERIQKIASVDKRVKFFERNKKAKGASVCRNIGLEKAKGNYIIFLDSDDVLAPWCLQQRIACMQNNTHLDFAVFHAHTFKKKPGDGALHTRLHYKNHLYHFIASHCIWQTMCPIWKKEFLVNIGGFDESYQRFQDAELHTKALLVDEVKYRVYKDLKYDCYFRVGHEKRSKNFWTKVTDAYVYYANEMLALNQKNLNPNRYQLALSALNYFGLIYCLKGETKKANEVLIFIKYYKKSYQINLFDYYFCYLILILLKYGVLKINIFQAVSIRILSHLCFQRINKIS